MGMPVLDMFGLSYVLHPAGWAGTGLFAAASFAMHRADVSRGIFLSCVFAVFVLVVATTGGKAK